MSTPYGPEWDIPLPGDAAKRRREYAASDLWWDSQTPDATEIAAEEGEL